jgi:acylphosphatase
MMGMSQSDKQKIEELYAVISGYVQGVGFRYFVVRKAQNLGLRGYARNASDGTVEVVAQGPRPELERLLSLLRQGPSEAEVQEIRTAWREPSEQFSGFNVRW